MGYVIGLLIFGGAWFGLSRQIYQIAQSPDAIALLPQSPQYRLPHQWGGPLPEELEPPLVAGEFGQAADLYAPITPATAAAPRGDHPITAPGSGDPVMYEPQGDHPHHRTITDLILAAPYPSTGSISPDEIRLFDALKSERRKQTEIIELIWGCKKGGTDAYNRARDRYMMLAESWHKTRKLLEA